MQPVQAAAGPDTADESLQTALKAIPELDFATATARLESVAHALSRGENTLIRQQQLVAYGVALQTHCETFLADRRTPPVVLMLDGEGRPTGTRPLPDH